jgi:hypothetical protein
VSYSGGATALEHAWTARGFEVRTRRDDRDDMLDVHHRNRLVERVIFGPHDWRVTWPFADRTNGAHEAVRRGARLVHEQACVVEVDLGPRQTGRPLAHDWVARVEGLRDVERLMLLDASFTDDDLARVVAAMPKLTELRVDRARRRPTDRVSTRRGHRTARPGRAAHSRATSASVMRAAASSWASTAMQSGTVYVDGQALRAADWGAALVRTRACAGVVVCRKDGGGGSRTRAERIRKTRLQRQLASMKPALVHGSISDAFLSFPIRSPELGTRMGHVVPPAPPPGRHRCRPQRRA